MPPTVTRQFWQQITQLWEQTQGSPQIKVAVIDGPVNLHHPCFEGANLQTTATKNRNSVNGLAAHHGTHVTSVIFGQHHSPVKGIAPDCQGVVIPVFGEKPNGDIQPTTQTNLARAITQAVDQGAHIINISAGEHSKTGESSIYLEKAIAHCEENGVLIVSATGNNGCACVHVPAAHPQVLAVGALGNHGQPLNFSNWGETYQNNGVLAPGHHILGAVGPNKTTEKTGTSFATPLVTGVLALLMSLQQKMGLTPDSQQIKEALLKTALACKSEDQDDPQGCDRYLHGTLNIEKALQYLKLSPTPIAPTYQRPMFPQALPNEPINLKSLKSTNMNDNKPTSQETTGAPSSVTPQTPEVVPNEVAPSCGCNHQKNLVFALGSLWMDYPTQAVLDSFKFFMRGIVDDPTKEHPITIPHPNPYNPIHLLAYLNGQQNRDHQYIVHPHHYDSARLTWILRQEEMPIYAIRPTQAFATETYTLLRDFLQPFDDKMGGAQAIDLVSIPGTIVGETKLYSGEVIPVIEPNIRAMYNWRSKDLVDTVLRMSKIFDKDKIDEKDQATFIRLAKPRDQYDNEDDKDYTTLVKKYGEEKVDGIIQQIIIYKEAITSFVNRIYFEFRNLGVTSAERALNHTGTNIFWLASTFFRQINKGYALHSISVSKSAVCRPDSDCQDVILRFFNPQERLNTATEVFKYTIDVSQVIPVSIGQPRNWFEN